MVQTERVANAAASSAHAAANWQRSHAVRLTISDAIVIAVAMLVAQLVAFGLHDAPLVVRGRLDPAITAGYTVLSVVLGGAWLLMLGFMETRAGSVLGAGIDEYKRVASATGQLIAFVAIVVLLLKIDVSRLYVFTAFLVGLMLLWISRWVWRNWLVRKRRRGEFLYRTLIIGSEQTVQHLIKELAPRRYAGYEVVGVCLPEVTDASPSEISDVPVLGSLDEVIDAVERTEAHTVAVTGSDQLSSQVVKRLSWQLEQVDVQLVVAPVLTDIVGPRMHTRPVAGLPLIHIEAPSYTSGRRFIKRTFDIIFSALALIGLSPILLVIALAVKLTSPGPVLFKQQRIGLHGKPFTMLKFRTMVVNAEELLVDLQAQADAGNAVLFKMKDDPRTTKLGRILRRFSLDELPQFVNSLVGSMSVVGPRPPLPSEVARYEEHVNRRFLAKPGITGLWQVSGRSELSWEDSVRLDLFYVENWSLTGDLVIIYRTIVAMFRGKGAY